MAARRGRARWPRPRGVGTTPTTRRPTWPGAGVGIKRAGLFAAAERLEVGKSMAIVGLVLGAVGLVATIVVKGFLF